MTRPKIDFKKIKIDGDDVISFVYAEHTSSGLIERDEVFPFKPHNDFKAAFQELVPHVCILAEQYDENGNTIPATHDPSKENEPYMRCCGVSLSGKDEKASIVFTAVRYLTTGKAITINTPNLSISMDDSNPYPQKQELGKVLKALKEEALAYLFDAKYAPDPQGDLFKQESSPAATTQDQIPEKVKNPRKKKGVSAPTEETDEVDEDGTGETEEEQ